MAIHDTYKGLFLRLIKYIVPHMYHNKGRNAAGIS